MKVIAITPKLNDFLVASIIEGLYKNGVEVIASDKGNYVKKVYSDKKILLESKDADYIFAFWGKVKNNKKPKYYLLEKIDRPEITAYIDGSEWTSTGYPEKDQPIESIKDPSRRKGKDWINKEMKDYCKWYFKRECYPEDKKRGLIPLLFGSVDKYFGHFNIEKKIDIFCSFGQNWTGLRKEVEEVCEKLGNEGYKVVVVHGFSYKKYLKLISSSYISIDAFGGGDCCARIWENIANKSCCFCQKYNIEFPQKFIDGESYVEFKTIEEFEEKLRYYLKNKVECLRIANNGYKHLIKYHTSKERVKYMLDQMK